MPLIFTTHSHVCTLIYLPNGTNVLGSEFIEYSDSHKNIGVKGLFKWVESENNDRAQALEVWWKTRTRINSILFLLTLMLGIRKINFLREIPVEVSVYSSLFLNVAIEFAVGDFVDRVWFDITVFTWNDWVVIGIVFITFLYNLRVLDVRKT